MIHDFGIVWSERSLLLSGLGNTTILSVLSAAAQEIVQLFQLEADLGRKVRELPYAFQAREVIIVGRRRWNRRGAMVTDRYLHVRHLDTPADLAAYAVKHGYTLVAVDNLPGAVPLETTTLPRHAVCKPRDQFTVLE